MHAARQPRSWLIFDVRQKETMRFAAVLFLGALVGCVCVRTPKEAEVEALLTKGDYRGAIAKIERGGRSADWRFALGMLYAYRELEENGEKANFVRSMELIRSAARELETAKRFVSDYDLRGAQAFYAFPWAHWIGPFPERPTLVPKQEPNKAPEPTPGTVTPRAIDPKSK